MVLKKYCPQCCMDRPGEIMREVRFRRRDGKVGTRLQCIYCIERKRAAAESRRSKVRA